LKKHLVTFRSKLGAAKNQPRSRIWIEGKRLADAGFTVGKYFAKEYDGGPDEVVLKLTLLKDDDVLATAPCKVSGKGDKPIIDITGELVRASFGHATHVEVTFQKGKIVIRAAADAAPSGSR
jgi:hypothetical protein